MNYLVCDCFDILCVQVWMYEACRLFRDKLVEEEDIQKFDGFLLSSIQSDWGVDMRDSLLNTYYVTSAIATVGDKVLFITALISEGSTGLLHFTIIIHSWKPNPITNDHIVNFTFNRI